LQLHTDHPRNTPTPTSEVVIGGFAPPDSGWGVIRHPPTTPELHPNYLLATSELLPIHPYACIRIH